MCIIVFLGFIICVCFGNFEEFLFLNFIWVRLFGEIIIIYYDRVGCIGRFNIRSIK